MLKINNELRDLIPPLTVEERTNLEVSIKAEGCRDCIVVWNDTIVDGHNRFEICTANNISFKTISKDFVNINAAKLWMIDNQAGRRNLTDGWKFELAQKKKELLLEKHEMERKERRVSNVDTREKKSESGRTQKELAATLGWSTGKIATADIVWKEASQEIKEEVKKGNKTFNEAYKEIKQEKRKQKIAQQIEEIKKDNLAKPSGNFDVIVIDPPWPYETEYSPDHYMGRSANPYPSMPIPQITQLKLPAKDDCILWLWTTHSFIWDAKEIMKSWGFEYKCILVWDKESIGIGKWLRKQCEFCLLGVKGKPIWTATNVRDIIREQKTEHSVKPEVFYEMVDEICVGRKLDYFARKKRDGWTVFGDEIK